MKLIISLFSLLIISYSIFSQNQWVLKDSLPIGEARHHPVTWEFGDTAYMLTGTKGTGTSDFQSDDFFMYIGADDEWTRLPDFPGPDRSFAYGDTYAGKGYIGFGASQFSGYLEDLWEYDPETQIWTELASCPCSGRRHPAFVINNGKIYVGLGDDAFSNLNDWWAYDIASDTWGQLPNLPGPQRHHPFHFSVGEYVYAGFGHGSSIFDDWYRFDPSDSSWTAMNNLSGGARVAGTEFSYNGKGYVLSGENSFHQNFAEGEFWEYNTEDDSWLQLPSHPGAGRWAPACFVLGNEIYIVGGEDADNVTLRRDVWAYTLPEIIDSTNIDSTINDSTISSTSFNISFDEEIRVSPNPSRRFIRISGVQANAGARIRVYDLNGKIVLEESFSTQLLDIQALSKGAYILQIIQDDQKHKPIRFLKF